MNEEIPIVPILVGAVGVLYLGYEIEKRRHRLRETFNVFDKQESVVGKALEMLVESGQLRPYVPGQAT
jgi:hypothetical protein